MEQINNSKGTPTKGSSTHNKSDSDNNFRSFDHGNEPEIREPNPSTAIPTIPDEIPIR